ncbi:MAG: SPOR domain-containing protein [Gemmatimonadota bacterium]
MRAERVLLLIIAAVVACSRETASVPSSATAVAAGPDPVVLRIPRGGGTVRAYIYPAVDSVVWRSSQALPAVDRVLAFDAENGVLAFADSSGAPGWLDLQLGSVRRSDRRRLRNVVSADGWSIYGILSESSFVRTTPSGDWTFSSRRRLRRLFPFPDGSLVVLGGVPASDESSLFRLRPPEETVTDSADVPGADRVATTPVGERLYLSSGRRLLGVPPNEIGALVEYRAPDDILAIAPTPSGDRVFVAHKGSERLEVVDKYSGDMEPSLRLPGFATELRMDPVGRFLLARPTAGDSVWVIDIGAQRHAATLPTGWRSDLPFVTVDGRVATLAGGDVVFVDPLADAATPPLRVRGGALDHWFFSRWNGFRPRARGIDVPVAFQIASDAAPVPSIVEPRDSGVAAEPPTPPPPSPALPAQTRPAWIVSFAAVLSPDRAAEIARDITVDGSPARVIVGETAGTRVYRVILGPYATRDDAERVGRASRHSYWVYEAVP